MPQQAKNICAGDGAPASGAFPAFAARRVFTSGAQVWYNVCATKVRMRRGAPPKECEGTRRRMVLLDEVKRRLSELQPEVADLADALAIERSKLRL